MLPHERNGKILKKGKNKKESHNPKVVGSNPAPATKNNRLNWENSSGVFLCQGSKTGNRVGIRVGVAKTADQTLRFASAFCSARRVSIVSGVSLRSRGYGGVNRWMTPPVSRCSALRDSGIATRFPTTTSGDPMVRVSDCDNGKGRADARIRPPHRRVMLLAVNAEAGVRGYWATPAVPSRSGSGTRSGRRAGTSGRRWCQPRCRTARCCPSFGR